MQTLHLPDNIKVHYAGAEVANQFICTVATGIQYYLYTCYPFVERKLYKKGLSPIMPFKWQRDNLAYHIPHAIIDSGIHTIQDSGIFTLMYGTQGGKKDEQLLNRYYDALIEFTLENGIQATCVEIDCQKILSPAKAWEYRKRMRRDLPNNRIINVFHIEDGQNGLDRLIEFSDYIAIGAPELRREKKLSYLPHIARYIKSRKPNIDIHLLGCTELKLLQECSFCTSADSTTYIAAKKYGMLQGKHISSIKTKEVQKLIGADYYSLIREYCNEVNANALILDVLKLKEDYQQYAGNQDYKIPTIEQCTMLANGSK